MCFANKMYACDYNCKQLLFLKQHQSIDFFMVNCCVFFDVLTEYLNIFEMSFSSKGTATLDSTPTLFL